MPRPVSPSGAAPWDKFYKVRVLVYYYVTQLFLYHHKASVLIYLLCNAIYCVQRVTAKSVS